MRHVALAVALLLSTLLVGCSKTHHFVDYSLNTFPAVDSIHVKGLNCGSFASCTEDSPEQRYVSLWRDKISYEVTRGDIQSGEVVLPTLVLMATGYLPYELDPDSIALDADFWSNQKKYTRDWVHHEYSNEDQVSLQPDPDFAGFPKNLWLALNSEPPGAKVYEKGTYIATTPDTLSYEIDPSNYQDGFIRCRELTLVLGGFKPKTFTPHCPLDSDAKYTRQDIHKSQLVVLDAVRPAPVRARVPRSGLP